MWVHVGSGLTSRCITLAHAHYLVKNKGIGKKLTIVWPISNECKISYYDVFDHAQFDDIPVKVIELRRAAVISAKEEKHISEGGAKYYLAQKNPAGALTALWIEMKLVACNIIRQMVIKSFKLRDAYYDYTPPAEIGWGGRYYDEYIEQTWQNIYKGICRGKEMYVTAGSVIIRGGQELEEITFDCIKFRKEYWNTVESILKKNKNYIGIHIRRTDHNVAIKGSKTEDFIKRIDSIVEMDEEAKFFLATDDKREEAALIDRYGSKIITMGDKTWGRNSDDGMKSAIIDVLCLSQCKYILGSYTSVFSYFAAAYGHCDLVICKSDE